jgi:hypothetical protein
MNPNSVGWHGAPRKSRKRRLPVSETSEPPAVWSPTDTDWGRLETAYGQVFSNDLMAEIKEAAQKYLDFACFEMVAPSADVFIKKLVKARKLARELEKEFHSFGVGRPIVTRRWKRHLPPEEEECAHEAHANLDDTAQFMRIFDIPCKPSRGDSDFSQVLHRIFLALDSALRDVAHNNSPAFSEGDAWSQLVIDLVCAFESRDLGVSATKNADRQLSPFVRFVNELQATFKDEKFRRHPTGPGLSRAISQVLRHISSTLFILFFLPCYVASKYGGGDLARLTPDNIPP